MKNVNKLKVERNTINKLKIVFYVNYILFVTTIASKQVSVGYHQCDPSIDSGRFDRSIDLLFIYQ